MSDAHHIITKDLIPCCCFCGSVNVEELGMVPTLNSKGHVIAYVFVCNYHFEKVLGKSAAITFGEEASEINLQSKGLLH